MKKLRDAVNTLSLRISVRNENGFVSAEHMGYAVAGLIVIAALVTVINSIFGGSDFTNTITDKILGR